MAGPVLSTLRERTGSSIAEIGSLFLVLQLGFIVGSVLAGRILDRFDGNRVYALGFLMLAAALMALTFATSLGSPGMMLGLAVIALVAFARANTVLGG